MKLEKLFQPEYSITDAIQELHKILNQDPAERPFEAIAITEHIRHICNGHLGTNFTFSRILSLIKDSQGNFKEDISELSKNELDLLNWNSPVYHIYKNIRFLIETLKMKESSTIPAKDLI